MAKQTGYHPKLAAYWGIIQQQVQNKASVANIWNAVRTQAEAEGADLSGVRIFDMNRIRSLAVEVREAGNRFASAAGNAAIDSSMISQYINSRELRQQNELPVYSVRFEQHVTENGEPVSVWRTLQYTGAIPNTKDALLAEIEANAMAFANKYNQTHMDVGQVQIAVI